MREVNDVIAGPKVVLKEVNGEIGHYASQFFVSGDRRRLIEARRI
jgi:hypothetical protein